MNGLLEKMKTAVLLLLVAGSLVQTYFLAYGMPKFDKVTPTDYVQTELGGTQAELADLMFPEEIVLHNGNGTHTVLLPNPNIFFYSNIYEFLKQRTFEGFRRTTFLTSSPNWEQIRNHQVGLEVRFKEGIPLSVLKTIMRIQDDNPNENDIITRIWIYNASEDEVRTYFFTDTPSVVYESVKADLNTKDVENKVGLGQYQALWTHNTMNDTYLPTQDIEAVRLEVPYSPFTPDKLKRSLFADPELTRNLLERDGTQIYTDGKRGLQIKNDQHWLVYSDPVYSTSTETRIDTQDNLLSAIQFVNQHGGWNSGYLYSRSTIAKQPSTGPQTLFFRQYVEGLPVIGSHDESFGYIKVSLQKGVVSSYERSMLNLNLEPKSIHKEAVKLPGGKTLEAMINAYPRKLLIEAVYPAYQPMIREQTVDLVPRWAVELSDGTTDFL